MTALSAATVLAQALGVGIQRQAKAGLKHSASVSIPALKVQGAVLGASAQGGDVHRHIAQPVQHRQYVEGHGLNCRFGIRLRGWAKAQHHRLLALQAPHAQLFTDALQRQYV